MEQLQEGIYQGVKSQHELKRDPTDPHQEEMPSYEQYQRDRARQ